MVLADPVKNLGWRARRATQEGRVSAAELEEVRAKPRALVG
jgi:mRNA-degrading endonuclease toxin of MazEF toxin-antitoxin module